MVVPIDITGGFIILYKSSVERHHYFILHASEIEALLFRLSPNFFGTLYHICHSSHLVSSKYSPNLIVRILSNSIGLI